MSSALFAPFHEPVYRTRLKQESLRTLFAIAFFGVVGYMMAVVQLLGDDRLVMLGLTKMPALPDIGIALAPHPPWFPSWSCEIPLFSLILTSFIACIMSARYHKGGLFFVLIYIRRLLWLVGLCYMFRLLALGGTTLPSSDPKCVFRQRDLAEFLTFGFKVVFGVVETCTDKLFSGHTTVASLLAWFWLASFWTKSSFLEKCVARTVAVLHVQILMLALLMSRGHYTVDMVLALIISSLVFHVFHLVLWIKEGMDKGNHFFSVRYGAGPTEVCRMHHIPDARLSVSSLDVRDTLSVSGRESIYQRDRNKPIPPVARIAFEVVGWMEGLDIRSSLENTNET